VRLQPAGILTLKTLGLWLMMILKTVKVSLIMKGLSLKILIRTTVNYMKYIKQVSDENYRYDTYNVRHRNSVN